MLRTRSILRQLYFTYLFISLFFGFQFLLGITVTPRRNRRQWLCDFFGGEGVAEDGWVNRVHYGLCENGAYYS